MPGPFKLSSDDAYLRWRESKLAAYPARVERLRVTVRDPTHPSECELRAIRARVGIWSMALIRLPPPQMTPQAILSLGRALGLSRTDANTFADAQAVSRITPTDRRASSEPSDRRGDFIPYTSKPLSWHTDGYYNAPDRQVRSWMLFCAEPARQGGENRLLDHEIAYIRLRDISPRLIEALCHPEALRIPAYVEGGVMQRPESLGPVFSVRDGALHMRYSARTKHVEWRDDADTAAARTALDELFSTDDAFTFTIKLGPGEGIVSNNVLHNRSGFVDDGGASVRRLLYRVRYLERISGIGPPP